MMQLSAITYRRPDGSFVGTVNGMPYHVVDDPAVCPPELWQQAVALAAAYAGEIPDEPAPAALPRPVPASISRRQCAREMFARGMITGPEMVAMTTTAQPPAVVEAVFSGLSESERWIALSDFGADTYERTNPLLNTAMTTVVLAGDPGQDAASVALAIDEFFRAASAH